MDHFDIIVIGFGKAGKTLAATRARLGEKVALVEASDMMYGGTCINVACIPTKALIESARRQAYAGEAPAIAYRSAIRSKDELTALLRQKNFDMINDLETATVILGQATFVSPSEVRIGSASGERIITGDRIFINTGSRPNLPGIPGLEESRRAYTSESLMETEAWPESLAIVGGGYVGLEFASMMAGFGTRVTILDAGDTFIPREDAEIASRVLTDFRERGIDVRLGVTVTAISDAPDHVDVSWTRSGEDGKVSADAVLIAAGRHPNTAGLALDKAGVETDARGAIVVDDHLRTTAPNIWAMGDVIGGQQFTYISLDDFRIVNDQLSGSGTRSLRDRTTVPYTVFIDPPLSTIGQNERDARLAGHTVRTAKLTAAAIPKSHILKNTRGLLKAVVDVDSGLILGASLYCEESHELINLIDLAIKNRIPYTQLRDQIFTHPTMSEGLNDLFKDIG